MKFGFSDEQNDMRATIRDFLAAKSPESAVRRLMATDHGYDPLVWKQMAGELGLQGLAIPEEYGGAGFTAVELGIVFEEMGRANFGGPFFATVAQAASLLMCSDDESAKQDYLPRIASGDVIATVATVEPGGAWDLDAVTVQASPDGSDYRISGVKQFVLDGHNADVIFVSARIDGELAVFAVEGVAEGLVRTPLPTLDQTRKQSRLDFDKVPARLVGHAGKAKSILSRAAELAVVALAAEQVGGAQRVLDASVDYAKVRVQFGRPIGGFQAIKHKCADMLLQVETAKSVSYYASWAGAEAHEELPVVAPMAKAYCSEAFMRCAADTIQIHGGIGFTWEHFAHLYFKRAKSSELLFGDPAHHRKQLADRLSI
jgi:alkylation response protein AidB-like acyl-CoA dehydrogenase